MKKETIMKVVMFAVVLFIPLIYSFFYLKSYWDPYGNLADMKIAVVNLDEGEDEENQGEEFINELKESDTFNICKVNLDEANKGMQDGDYYAMITIPSNFTNYLNSASTTDKQIATITYNPNQASNYLATQIVGSAMKTIEKDLQAKVNSEVVENLAENLKEVPDNLQEISNGSKEILSGSEELDSGLEQINNGTETLDNNYSEFDKGIDSAYNGSKSLENGLKSSESGVESLTEGAKSLNTAIVQINDGANELSEQGNEGITTLSKGISDLNDGAEKLDSGVETYVDGTIELSNGVNSYVEGTETLVSYINTYIDGVDELNGNVEELLKVLSTQSNSEDELTKKLAIQAKAILDSNSIMTIKNSGTVIKQGATELTSADQNIKFATKQLIDSGSDLKNGADTLYGGTQTLLDGASSLTRITDGITSIKSALEKVKTGTGTLENGIENLSSGTTELKLGSDKLAEGLLVLDNSSKQIKVALNTLNNGAKSAYEGSTELVNGVQTFNDEINNGIKETREELTTLDGIKEFSENPVEIKTESYGEVNSYGVAFTPLFLCIGLWVGALMCYVVFYYDQKNRFGILGSHSKNKFLQNLIYILLGAIEGLITAALLKAGLGIEIENTKLYYFSSILIGITFMSIIQLLIRNFGDVGKFIALIILVLQLAASGGTFPVETIDKGFQAISSYLPMTYSINLLREILVPTATNFKIQYIGILMGITIVSVGVTYIVDIIRKKCVKE